MRTLNVSISEIEYNKFGLKEEKLTFIDLIDIANKELKRQNLSKCLELANKYGISKMTMDEIKTEVKAVRKNATNRNRYERHSFSSHSTGLSNLIINDLFFSRNLNYVFQMNY